MAFTAMLDIVSNAGQSSLFILVALAFAGNAISQTTSELPSTNSTLLSYHANATAQSSAIVAPSASSTALAGYIVAGISEQSLSSETLYTTTSGLSENVSTIAPISTSVSSSQSLKSYLNSTFKATGTLYGYNSTGNATASAWSEASACQSSSLSWKLANSDTQTCVYNSITASSTWIATLGTGDVYTTRDGIPIARGSFTSTGSTTLTSYSLAQGTSSSCKGQPPNYSTLGPMPICTFNSSICTSMYSQWMAKKGLTLFKDPIPTQTTVDPNSPQCPPPLVSLNVAGAGTSTIYSSCSFWAGMVQIYFWPPETSAAITSAATAPTSARTVRVGNMTFTSPSVYASFDTLTAWIEQVNLGISSTTATVNTVIEHQVGPALANVVLSMRPEDVSTYQYSASDWSKVASAIRNGSFDDFASFRTKRTLGQFNATYVTSPAFPQYFLGGGAPLFVGGDDFMFRTMFEGDYRPQLSLPSQLRNLNSAWKSCDPAVMGVYDPPTALQAAPEAPLTYPSASTATPTTSAQPISTQPAPTPYATPSSVGPAAPASTTIASATAEPQVVGTTASQTVPGYSSDSTDSVGEASQPATGNAAGSSGAPSPTDSYPGADTSSAINTNQQVTPTAGDETAPSSSPPPTTTNALSVLLSAQTSSSPAASLKGSSYVQGDTTGALQTISFSVVQPSLFTNSAIVQLPGPDTGAFSTDTLVAFPTAQYTQSSVILPTGGPAVTTIGTQTFSATKVGVFVDSQFVSQAGSPKTIDGAIYTVDSSGQLLYLSTGTDPSDPQPTASAVLGIAEQLATIHSSGLQEQAILTVNGQTLTAYRDQSVAIIDGTTISVQGPAITMGSEQLSLASQGLVVGGLSSADPNDPGLTNLDPEQVATVVVGSQTITATETAGPSYAEIQGQTVTLGGSAITLDGQTVSLGSAGLIVADGEQTQTAIFESVPAPVTDTIVVGTSTLIAVESSGPDTIVIGGSTLSLGGAPATIAGATLSLASNGLVVADPESTSTYSFLDPASPANTKTTVRSTLPTVTGDPSSAATKAPASSQSTASSAAGRRYRDAQGLLVVGTILAIFACIL